MYLEALRCSPQQQRAVYWYLLFQGQQQPSNETDATIHYLEQDMDSTVVAMPSPVDPPAPGPMWSQHRLPVAIPRAERAFIPADTAKRQVSSLVEQMGQIKASHERAISQLEASFAEAESRTRAHYTDVIRNLKQQANEKLMAKRAELAALNNQLEEQQAEHARLVAEQEVKNQEAAAALQQMQQAADESLRTADEAHNEVSSPTSG